MTKNIAQYLDRPIAFSPILAKISGSVKAGLFLSQAIYWTNRSSTGDGIFWKTQEQWEEETCLTRKEQEGVRARLKKLGILEEIKQGLPCRIFFKVNFDVIDELITEYSESKKQDQHHSAPPDTKQKYISPLNTQILINTTVAARPPQPVNLTLDFPIDHYEGPSKIQKPKNELTEQVSQVFEFWKATMGHPKAKFDEKRNRTITKALKLGYSVKDLMDAISGCRQSPFNMGKGGNKDGTIYDALSTILQDAEHIDKYIAINENPPDEFKPKLKDHPKYNMIKRLVNLRRTDPEAYRNTLADTDIMKGIKLSDIPPPSPNELNVIYPNKIGELSHELS